MKQATAFVLSSLFEGFGNVIVEAMALGVPVIATDCPSGPSEIITDNVDGLLVPPADAQSLAAAIERILSDDDLRERLAGEGQVRAKAFDPRHIARRYEEILS